MNATGGVEKKSGYGTPSLHAGLEKKCPPFPDKSTELKGRSVNDNATRKKTAVGENTLGRSA